ncbi:MAG: C39 family peptidase [Lachnospiraceae bacterium]|nr:C39 family peptidase [Lachnospiraceae bacterium]MBR0434481.1 C39 family peptidase [Lachnospiraceae bacterium]
MKTRKTYKKLIAFILILAMFFSASVSIMTAWAKGQDSLCEEDIEFARKRAELFLKNANKDNKIEDGILADNLLGDYEVISFNISGGGYIIVNLKDLSIPELSFENLNPFIGVEYPIYNGSMCYYNKQGDAFVSITTGEIIGKNQFDYIYCKDEIEDKQEFIEKIEEASKKRLLKAITERKLSKNLKLWYVDGGHCGPIACALCLRFYYDCVDKSYLKRQYMEQDELIGLMIDYTRSFWSSTGTYANDLERGLNSYFDDMNIDNRAIAAYYFDFDLIKSKINTNRPIIVGTKQNAEYKYENHWMVVHGYFINREANLVEKFFIVNDGWRHNNVWINLETERQFYDSMVYFSK